MSAHVTIEAIFRDVLQREDISLRPEMTAFDVEGWDSLAHLKILVEIEKRLAVKLDVGEVIRLRNIGELIQLVDKRLAAKRAA